MDAPPPSPPFNPSIHIYPDDLIIVGTYVELADLVEVLMELVDLLSALLAGVDIDISQYPRIHTWFL